MAGAARLFPGDLRKALYFSACGAVGGAIGGVISEVAVIAALPDSEILDQYEPTVGQLYFHVGLWFAIIGGCIALAILVAQRYYLQRDLKIHRPLLYGSGFGFVSGFIAGAVAQAAYTSIGPTEVLRVICWGIAGGLLGLALSFRIPNLAARRGLGGGSLGGVIGGSLFILTTYTMDETSGRLLGVAAIGSLIGLMIVLADTLFREAWLEVRYAPKESRTVSLGGQPIRFGSDQDTCTVYVRGVPAVACIYRSEHGRVVCEDPSLGQIIQVQPGDQRQVGNLTVILHTAHEQRSVSAVPAYTSDGGFILWLSARRNYQLAIGRKLGAPDIPGLEPHAADGIVAEVACNPSDPKTLGLRNRSHRVWFVSLPGGNKRQIEPGKTIRLSVGTKINFGPIEGEIRSA